MHDCYELLSPAAMRTAAQFSDVGHAAPPEWRDRILTAIDNGAHPRMLHNCGVTAPLLAYCGITLETLVERPGSKGVGLIPVELASNFSRYPLEHLIDALELSMPDLLLLGFKLPMLAQPALYPLIVLYDKCELRADTIFKFHISYNDLQRSVLDVDARYVALLNLNTHWLQRAIGSGAPTQ